MDEITYNIWITYLCEPNSIAKLSPEQQKHLKKHEKNYKIINNKLYHRKNEEIPKRVIKKEEKEIILKHLHDDETAGHLGQNITINKIKERYFWPNIAKDVREYIQACTICQQRGRPKTTEPLNPIRVGGPFDRIGIDIVGPLPVTSNRNQFIVVAMDYLTKWPEARAIRKANAANVEAFIKEDIIARHGCPLEILSDQGTHFVNATISQLCERLKIKRTLSSPYHPQTNGLVERYNRTLCESLAKLSIQSKTHWDGHISAALLAYRTACHDTTGYTPFDLMYGRTALLPIDLEIPTQIQQIDDNEEEAIEKRIYDTVYLLNQKRFEAKRNIENAQTKQKERHNQYITPENYDIGELVLVYRSKTDKQ